ncbi:guanine nucleotide exchange factor [Anaeramoeba ignava]|uniref:Guanine nucleotide exchange factor n=1 Tax=Anaeramoeba ignava TaxID=1746090 RepID=A0A9Q0LIF6_ANAIG|nr:guanine nucleotide exchange factor [Anaeramoeba ignava]
MNLQKKNQKIKTKKSNSKKKKQIELNDNFNQENIFELEPMEIAKQLTIFEYDLFCEIGVSEFFNNAWYRTTKFEKSPNIVRIIDHFNSLSKFISTQIIQKQNLKERVKIVDSIIMTVTHLVEMRNFNTTVAFLAGLNSSSVYRLKRTFEKLSEKTMKKFEEIKEMFKADKAYSNLRFEMKKSQKPFIPYLGLFLTDLTFIHEGNPDSLNDLINFTKLRFEYNVLTEFYSGLDGNFDFIPIPQFQRILYLGLKGISERKQYDLSLKIEPRKR